jgi:hypothetical protein
MSSKKLEKRANRLERKAHRRVLTIKRIVREYRDATQLAEASGVGPQAASHRDIERAVARYNEVHKALKRISKKLQLKIKDPHRSAVGSLNDR